MDAFVFLLVIAALVIVPIVWSMKVMKPKGYGGGVSFFMGLLLGFVGVLIAYLLPVKWPQTKPLPVKEAK